MKHGGAKGYIIEFHEGLKRALAHGMTVQRETRKYLDN